MYLTLLPTVSPLDAINSKIPLTHYAFDPKPVPFDPSLLIFNKVMTTPHSLEIYNYLRCFQFHEVAHLVLEGDDRGDIPQKYIQPVIRLALGKFLSTATVLNLTHSVTCEGPLEMHKLMLARRKKQQEVSLLFFPPGSIELGDWVVGQPLHPHRNYASLSSILLPIFNLVPRNEKTMEFFVSDEIHSMLLRVTHFPDGPNVGAYVGAHIFENHSVRAGILSVLLDHASDMNIAVGDHDHFSAVAGVLPKDPETSVVGGDQRCMLDFDLYIMERRQGLWQHFLEWKNTGERQALQTVLLGTDIPARSGSFLRRHLPWRSPFPRRRVCDADLADLSPSPRLKDPIAAVLLEDDHDFTFHLDEPIKTGPDRYSQTYFGHASILGKTSKRLCLKLFDERLFHVVPANEEDLFGRPVSFTYRLATFNVAEELAWREEAAYDVLDYLQGGLLPYSYGFHYFRLPDGHECLGFVMEAVNAPQLEPDLGEWSQERQIDLIKLMRKAFRALRYAGVFQTDWHWGQFLFINQPDPQFVLIDFAFALQYPCLCHTPHPPSTRDDWLQVRNLLNGSGVEHDLLDKYWLERDDYEH